MKSWTECMTIFSPLRKFQSQFVRKYLRWGFYRFTRQLVQLWNWRPWWYTVQKVNILSTRCFYLKRHIRNYDTFFFIFGVTACAWLVYLSNANPIFKPKNQKIYLKCWEYFGFISLFWIKNLFKNFWRENWFLLKMNWWLLLGLFESIISLTELLSPSPNCNDLSHTNSQWIIWKSSFCQCNCLGEGIVFFSL